MRALVVSEFYPRAFDEVLGVWAHRQAVATRDAGVDVEVLVLHRPVPPASDLRAGPRQALRTFARMLRQPRERELDGLRVTYVPFLAPARPGSYGDWGRWAARPLARAIRRAERGGRFDVIHAHNAVPAADALRRRGLKGWPLITSVHGGDVYHTAVRSPAWAANVTAGLDASDLVLANSSGIADACRELTSSPVEVLLLGADVPPQPSRPSQPPLLVTVAHLVERKRHADVLRAMWILRDRWPQLRYRIVGDGPERGRITELASELGLAERVELTGQLEHEDALAALDDATLSVMPSVDEAYGVAYVEALARGIPVIGALGEPGPLDLADLQSGIQLAAPGDAEHLARVLDRLLGDPERRRELCKLGRSTVERRLSWDVCGRATRRIYERVVEAHRGG